MDKLFRLWVPTQRPIPLGVRTKRFLGGEVSEENAGPLALP